MNTASLCFKTARDPETESNLHPDHNWIGFGDILPQTPAERVMTTIIICLTACLFAFLLGSVTSLVGAAWVRARVRALGHLQLG